MPGSVDEGLFTRVEEAFLRDAIEPGTRAWLEQENPDALRDVTTTLPMGRADSRKVTPPATRAAS